MRIIACERFGVCLATASRATAIGRRSRSPKDFAPMRRKRLILPTGQSATVWSAWHCFPWVTWKAHIIRFRHDPRLFAHSFHSRILWLLGFADQALRSVECQLVDARASD